MLVLAIFAPPSRTFTSVKAPESKLVPHLLDVDKFFIEAVAVPVLVSNASAFITDKVVVVGANAIGAYFDFPIGNNTNEVFPGPITLTNGPFIIFVSLGVPDRMALAVEFPNVK